MKEFRDILNEGMGSSGPNVYSWVPVHNTDNQVAQFMVDDKSVYKMSAVSMDPPLHTEWEVDVTKTKKGSGSGVGPADSIKIICTVLDFLYYMPGSSGATTVNVYFEKDMQIDTKQLNVQVAKSFILKLGFRKGITKPNGFTLKG